MVRCGIIGTGIIARAHAEGIEKTPDATLSAICDVKPEAMDVFLSDMQIEKTSVACFTDYKELILSKKVDAIYICTPTKSHCEIACFATKHHLFVFCEKPIAMNEKEAERMVKSIEETQVVGMVGFAFRYIPAVDYIKSLINEGKLGKIRHFKGYFYANRLADEAHELEWRHLKEIAGSGVVGDLICHVADLSQYLLGWKNEELQNLHAQSDIVVPTRRNPSTGKPDEVTAEDRAVVYATTKDKVQLLFEGSRYFPFEMGFQIAGNKGALKYNMMHYNEVETIFYEKEGSYSQKYSMVYERHTIPKAFQCESDVEGRFIRESMAFIEAVKGKRKIENDFEAGLKNQKLLDDIVKSF